MNTPENQDSGHSERKVSVNNRRCGELLEGILDISKIIDELLAEQRVVLPEQARDILFSRKIEIALPGNTRDKQTLYVKEEIPSDPGSLMTREFSIKTRAGALTDPDDNEEQWQTQAYIKAFFSFDGRTIIPPTTLTHDKEGLGLSDEETGNLQELLKKAMEDLEDQQNYLEPDPEEDEGFEEDNVLEQSSMLEVKRDIKDQLETIFEALKNFSGRTRFISETESRSFMPGDSLRVPLEPGTTNPILGFDELQNPNDNPDRIFKLKLLINESSKHKVDGLDDEFEDDELTDEDVDSDFIDNFDEEAIDDVADYPDSVSNITQLWQLTIKCEFSPTDPDKLPKILWVNDENSREEEVPLINAFGVNDCLDKIIAAIKNAEQDGDINWHRESWDESTMALMRSFKDYKDRIAYGNEKPVAIAKNWTSRGEALYHPIPLSVKQVHGSASLPPNKGL